MYIQVKLMPDSLPPLDLRGTAYCASFNLRRTARAITRLFDFAFQDCGIRSTQFTILIGVAKTQPTSIGALAKLLIIDPTTLTRSLRLLEKQGWLAISKRSTKRRRFVTLTAQGKQALARSLPAWRAVQERFVQAIGPEQWTKLRCELETLAHVAADLEDPREEPGIAFQPS